ncbi:hypothetical protein JKP88DRAFT_243919 [Tribonema minus]|uniref:Histone H2A n=1 Tax=Tribonema minus TaxID=303371 RepID=A0A835ZEE7_9STRA|nr:hypothetical protein JKP88DRAFT_243919 [Tribonema minus]
MVAVKRAAKAKKDGGKRKKAAPRTFVSNISDVCKTLHSSKVSLGSRAKRTLDSMALQVIDEVCTAAEEARKLSKRQTVSDGEVVAGVKCYLPGELLKHAIAEGTKAVVKYGATEKGSRTTRAGLSMSVSHTENRMRQRVASRVRVGDKAAVFLAAVVEYVVAEVVETAGSLVLARAATSKSKTKSARPRVKVADLMLAIEGDKTAHAFVTGKAKVDAKHGGDAELHELFGGAVYMKSM